MLISYFINYKIKIFKKKGFLWYFIDSVNIETNSEDIIITKKNKKDSLELSKNERKILTKNIIFK